MSEALRKALAAHQRVIDARERRYLYEFKLRQERAARPLQSAFTRKKANHESTALRHQHPEG